MPFIKELRRWNSLIRRQETRKLTAGLKGLSEQTRDCRHLSFEALPQPRTEFFVLDVSTPLYTFPLEGDPFEQDSSKRSDALRGRIVAPSLAGVAAFRGIFGGQDAAGYNTPTVALRVVRGGEKGTQCPGA
jgi:hypothetical protein